VKHLVFLLEEPSARDCWRASCPGFCPRTWRCNISSSKARDIQARFPLAGTFGPFVFHDDPAPRPGAGLASFMMC
jgi:hypothetical protein